MGGETQTADLLYVPIPAHVQKFRERKRKRRKIWRAKRLIPWGSREVEEKHAGCAFFPLIKIDFFFSNWLLNPAARQQAAVREAELLQIHFFSKSFRCTIRDKDDFTLSVSALMFCLISQSKQRWRLKKHGDGWKREAGGTTGEYEDHNKQKKNDGWEGGEAGWEQWREKQASGDSPSYNPTALQLNLLRGGKKTFTYFFFLLIWALSLCLRFHSLSFYSYSPISTAGQKYSYSMWLITLP